MKLILNEALGKTNPLKYSFGFNNLYDFLFFFCFCFLSCGSLTTLRYIYTDIKHTKGKINTTRHQNICYSESRVEVSAVFAQNLSPGTLIILNFDMFQTQNSKLNQTKHNL